MFSWGMIGLERMVMAFVMPAIQQDFKLSYTEVGALISAFGFAWALGTWSMGSLSDYIGRRLIIVVLMIFGGVCSWLTGIAGTFAMLLTIRAIMGFAEGGIAGPASAALAEDSPPQHRGRNLGLMTGSFVFLGGAVGPVLSTKLMASFGWRPVFFIYAIPAILLGILLFLVMREPASVQATIRARKEGKTDRKRLHGEATEIRYTDVFRNRNVILMIFIWTAQMVWMWLFTTFGVMFLTKVHRLPVTTVGLAMTGFGVGACLGTFIFGAMSDRLGRKKAIVLSLFAGGLLGIIFASLKPGTPLGLLFVCILAYSFASSGAGGASWIITAESVGFSLAATAIGLVTGVGELLGGGIFPIVGGSLADWLGLSSTLYLTGFILIASGILGLFLKEVSFEAGVVDIPDTARTVISR